MFWYSRHYMQIQTLFGLPPEQAAIRESLPIYLQAYSHPEYKLNVALLYGTQVENTDLFPSTATFAAKGNRNYAYPKLQYATFLDFFDFIENYGSRLCQLTRAMADLAGKMASEAMRTLPRETGGIRTAPYRRKFYRARLTQSIRNLNPPAGAFEGIWQNIILFAEHTWLSYNSVSQPDHDKSFGNCG